MVVFVNYEDIKREIISKTPPNLPLSGEEQNQENIWFYSSDYSDILGMDNLS
ncbi:hypothetical protein HOG21_05330 [bacterium]|jgi:hypothetical protein|nr:hypothetical protein [bacterium]